MGDREVAAALRSAASLVVVEAPGGCGKTYQAADYAAHTCSALTPGKLLILTHTHAACDVFNARTHGLRNLDIRTIDALIAQVVDAYPRVTSPPLEPDYQADAQWAADLLARRPFIAEAIAARHPIVICDEHQDASADQHALIEALRRAGARVRIFGDPMQRIYGASVSDAAMAHDDQRWTQLWEAADKAESLDTAHRWKDGGEALGDWILENRDRLQAGGKLRLSGSLPSQLQVIRADNVSSRNQGFQLESDAGRPVSRLLQSDGPLLILSHHNQTVRAIRAAFGRRLPIWEGHTRSALPRLAKALSHATCASEVMEATIGFVQDISTGFTDGDFATRLRQELPDGRPSARGKPGKLQTLARLIRDRPDHRGATDLLRELYLAIREDAAFKSIKIDYPREYWEAVRLGEAADVASGMAEGSRRNAVTRPMPPARAVSTIHKAKGLEAPHVLVMPCDATTFREKDRRLLYVAISRATRKLTLVVSSSNPSPLIEL